MTKECQQILHASCVSMAGRGVVILGASGTGKSALALQLMALGADLVADDQVLLRREDGGLIASAPPGLPPLIEARGIGLLNARLLAQAQVVLAVDLNTVQMQKRLPPKGHTRLLDVPVEVVHGPMNVHFAAAIRQYLLMGRGE